MKRQHLLTCTLAAAGLAMASQAALADITFYEHPAFAGQSFSTERRVNNFERYGFNDRASSAVVGAGERWEVCEHQGFGGRCVVLRPGNYPTLQSMGLDDRVSSVREITRGARVNDSRYAPEPVVSYDYRQRRNERLYEADVVAVHAVVGPPEQRCWVEREQIREDRNGNNVGGALAGALIGGILGHQIGGGTGRDVATVGGAVAGAAVGTHIARNGDRITTQNVQRCANVPSADSRPDYWDVTYRFRGQEHRVQMAVPPGSTVTVNDRGEPRARG